MQTGTKAVEFAARLLHAAFTAFTGTGCRLLHNHHREGRGGGLLYPNLDSAVRPHETANFNQQAGCESTCPVVCMRTLAVFGSTHATSTQAHECMKMLLKTS